MRFIGRQRSASLQYADDECVCADTAAMFALAHACAMLRYAPAEVRRQCRANAA